MHKFYLIIMTLFMSITLVGCHNEIKQEEHVAPLPQKEEVKKTSITLSFVGDVTLGNYAKQSYSGSFDQEYQRQNSQYFFKKVNHIFKEDDLTIANLEGPITTATKYADKQFAFKGNPKYIDILKDGNIDVVTLANNHSHDYFDRGMSDTKKYLDEGNIKHFGYEQALIEEVKGVKIGFLGYAFPQGFSEKMKKSIVSLKEQVDIVVVYFHWGIERDQYPLKSQRNIAKKCIDYGADLIIGSHPHVLQGIEKYKGKTIAYSLGNFCFGGNKNPSDKDTVIYQHTFDLENQKIVSQNYHIIPCSISSSSSRNNYQPMIVEGNAKDRVLNKIKEIN